MAMIASGRIMQDGDTATMSATGAPALTACSRSGTHTHGRAAASLRGRLSAILRAEGDRQMGSWIEPQLLQGNRADREVRYEVPIEWGSGNRRCIPRTPSSYPGCPGGICYCWPTTSVSGCWSPGLGWSTGPTPPPRTSDLTGRRPRRPVPIEENMWLKEPRFTTALCM